MLILYVKTGCPFCAKVLDVIAQHGIQIDERNIAEEENRTALIEKGGKQQVPYLIDEERGVSMYESDDIIAHLNEHYGN